MVGRHFNLPNLFVPRHSNDALYNRYLCACGWTVQFLALSFSLSFKGNRVIRGHVWKDRKSLTYPLVYSSIKEALLFSSFASFFLFSCKTLMYSRLKTTPAKIYSSSPHQLLSVGRTRGHPFSFPYQDPNHSPATLRTTPFTTCRQHPASDKMFAFISEC